MAASASETDPEIFQMLQKGMGDEPELRRTSVIIAVTPEGDFVTYGVGVPLLDMRDPKRARGRAPV